MESIATMQSIQASLLEYMMQFQLAVESQSKLNEIAYTVALTIITTAATLGIGSAMGMGSAGMAGLITEPLEEVFVDPVVEAIASKITRDLGGDAYAEMIASTLAESGREGFGVQGTAQQYRVNQRVKTMMRADPNLRTAQAKQQVMQEMQTQQKSSSKVANVAKMTFAIFSGIAVGGIFGGVCALGITALTGMLHNIGKTIKEYLETKEAVRKTWDEHLQVAGSPIGFEGLPSQLQNLFSWDQIMEAWMGDAIDKWIFQGLDPRKPLATDKIILDLVDKLEKEGFGYWKINGKPIIDSRTGEPMKFDLFRYAMITLHDQGYRFKNEDLLGVVREGGLMVDSRPRNDWRGLAGWHPLLPQIDWKAMGDNNWDALSNALRFEELRGYDYLRTEIYARLIALNMEYVASRFLYSSKITLLEWYNEQKKDAEEAIKKPSRFREEQKTIDNSLETKGYMKYSDAAWKSRVVLGINYVLYQFTCKLLAFEGMSYFGYTGGTVEKRIKEHIIEALKPRGLPDSYATLVPLHKAIREAISRDEVFRPFLGTTYKEYFEEGGTFDEIYEYLQTNYVALKSEVNYIDKSIFGDAFEVRKVELTREKSKVLSRENWHTLNYKNEKGLVKNIKGTVTPNGLNAVEGGLGGGREVEVPLIDIAAMLSLGLTYTAMTEILNEKYDSFGDFDKLSQEVLAKKIRNTFGSKHEAYMKFLLPVIEDLLKLDLDFTRADILAAIGWSKGKFTRHFGEMTLLKQLISTSGAIDQNIINKYLKASNLDKSIIQSAEGLYRELTRGVSLEQWKKWAIEGESARVIGESFPKKMSSDTIKDTYKDISHLLLGKQYVGLSYQEVTKELRRRIIIEKFRNPGGVPVMISGGGRGNEGLAWKICVDEFGLNPKGNYAVKLIFERIWKGKSSPGDLGAYTMTFQQIVDAYYNKPRNFLGGENS